jgi:anthranilate phosphoribosyltransferase
LQRLGTKHSLVVHSLDGMDEISISGPSMVWEVDEVRVSSPYKISPKYFGFKQASLNSIKGGTPQENARILSDILSGAKGPQRDVVVMNAAAVLLAANRASDLKEGARLAEEAIDNGKSREKLENFVKLSQSFG